MKTISEILRDELKTRDDITRVARSVEIKQRDAKRYAINYVVDAWERLCSAAERNETWYMVVHGYKCKQCGGVILRRVGPFSKLTCGGNPSIGCPVCKTISSSKMMRQRRDIIRSDDDTI